MKPLAAPREFEITIDRLSHEGRGVGRLEGKAVFVAQALPGERVRARYIRRHSCYDEAVAVEVLDASADRVAPPCAHAARCGGCSLQHLAPDAQLAHKQHVLLDQLRQRGGLTPARVLPPLASARLGYRRRARLSARQVSKKNAVLIGFREQASHFVAEIERCEVMTPALGHCLLELRELVSALSVAAHVPQIELAADDESTVVVLRHLRPLTDEDRARLAVFGQRTGLVVCLQAGAADSVRALDGSLPRLAYRVGASRIEFRPGDFVQVHGELNRALVPLAIDLLDVAAHDRVLDLFCGLGNFTLELARKAESVVGVELDAGLLERAASNARANDLVNCEFAAADLFAEEDVARVATAGVTRLLLDPPRSGAELALRRLDLGQVARVVYVSCNPATLARDADILVRERGYRLAAAGVIDMFPHTSHVESIGLFERG